jgi:hypothetical protein
VVVLLLPMMVAAVLLLLLLPAAVRVAVVAMGTVSASKRSQRDSQWIVSAAFRMRVYAGFFL